MLFFFLTGYETARSLALHGCTVVFACRDTTRAEVAIDKIKQERTNAVCEVIELDLASLQSVKTFVSTFKLRHKYVFL